MNKTIGFFGDSFCAERTNHHSLFYRYNSYIDLLAKHYDAKVVNLGHGGCSIYDTLLLQLQPLINSNSVPDICVFVWSSPGRLFNRTVRRINHGSAASYKPSVLKFLDRKIWQAAKLFYEHLYDHEKEELEHKALLNYIDAVILPSLPSTTKIVHLWSFGIATKWHEDDLRPSTIEYPHKWQHGSEIRPPLLSISLCDNTQEILSVDHRCNHLDGQFKNDTVFNWIKLAIDNPNSTWDYSTSVEKLYDTPQTSNPQAT
jgi:hypothetical protein